MSRTHGRYRQRKARPNSSLKRGWGHESSLHRALADAVDPETDTSARKCVNTDGSTKARFLTRSEAKRRAKGHPDKGMLAYRCPICGHFHIGHRRPDATQESAKMKRMSNEAEVDVWVVRIPGESDTWFTSEDAAVAYAREIPLATVALNRTRVERPQSE
jgi:hypothetical protein